MMDLSLNCPSCGAPVSTRPNGSKAWPFCSDRCKLLDLGAWAAEERRIAGEALSSSDFPKSEDDAYGH